MNDDCGKCPMCGEDLMFSKNKKLLYECSNAKCNYVEFQYQNMDKGKKKPGGLKMDILEKWNFLIEYYNKNQTAPEKIIQQDWENLFAEIFGYSKLLKEVDAHRTMQIGATSRVIPDIIIRSTQENRDLFVVELKQHTILTGYEQLFSYLKLLKVDIGILICNKLYIYDYDTDKDDDNQSFLEIEFTKDNPDGIKFVELFSKDSFDKENIKKFIRERKTEHQNIKAIRQALMMKDFVQQVLANYLSQTYPQETIQQALAEIDITVMPKGKQTAPLPVFSVTANIKPSIASAKDNTQYSVDGNFTGGKGTTAYEVVSRYISMHPNISYSELLHVFPDEAGKPGFGKCIRLVEEVTQEQWNRSRFSKHFLALTTGEKVVVSTQWTLVNFNNFMQYAARAGITITAK